MRDQYNTGKGAVPQRPCIVCMDIVTVMTAYGNGFRNHSLVISCLDIIPHNLSSFDTYFHCLNNYRIYFKDTGLLIGSLDDEVQEDLRNNKNFNTYKGALYENIIADMLVKQGYNLFFYKNEKGTLEMDFFIRDKNSLIPVEVKANDNATISLNNLIENSSYKDIKYGIKLCNKNIGFNGKFNTIPYFMTFLLKKYIRETK